MMFSTMCASAAKLEISIKGEGSNGLVVIDLYEEVAPIHVKRMLALASNGSYDGVVFHRVIEGFMAQTGDVQFGKVGGNIAMAGRGASEMPDLPAEFSNIPYDRGIVGMARSKNPNSANSQFFIMFKKGHHLNSQYTVVGKVLVGMEFVDGLERGEPPASPDFMEKVRPQE
jgi:peptidylprolyl isomerase